MRIVFLLVMLLFAIPVLAYPGKINYDYPGYNSLGERSGSVYINGERYNVTERTNSFGGTDMTIKNYNGTYRGTIDSYGYGKLKDYNGNVIKVKPY